ncbi:hypothetical protein EC912_10812 [Luteibacter rhizovicinus]|uniref:Deaminase of polymorphic toxin system n=1 Tax=Luteibacter rhizovicinus TaxID=242606 RepID=A0A4R3YIT1_9GAMM|nr:hypothetical protein [Luteibacter rhizovicinus]TCV92021.1 hypothetical protein EC912_10812 [Luteibacter rhizovicinus]
MKSHTISWHPMRRIVAGIATGAMLLVASGGAFAQSVELIPVDKVDADALGALMDTYGYHLRTADRWIKANTTPEQRIRSTFNKVETNFKYATIARFEYTYVGTDGNTHTKVYHSKSGPDVSKAFYGDGPLPPGVENVEKFFPLADEYSRASPGNESKSKIPSSPAGGKDRATDAELKAVRTIEADIVEGRVPGQGSVKGFVSKDLCDSCDNAVRVFAKEYNIDVKIDYFREVGTPIEVEFTSLRKQAVNQVRNVRNAPQPMFTLDDEYKGAVGCIRVGA